MHEKKTRSMEQKKLRRDLEGVAQAFKNVRRDGLSDLLLSRGKGEKRLDVEGWRYGQRPSASVSTSC